MFDRSSSGLKTFQNAEIIAFYGVVYCGAEGGAIQPGMPQVFPRRE